MLFRCYFSFVKKIFKQLRQICNDFKSYKSEILQEIYIFIPLPDNFYNLQKKSRKSKSYSVISVGTITITIKDRQRKRGRNEDDSEGRLAPRNYGSDIASGQMDSNVLELCRRVP